MFKNKKAQGLSIRTIIIAVIGLIVLVVVVGLLTGKFGVFESGVNKIFTTNTDEIRCCDKCDFGKIECSDTCEGGLDEGVIDESSCNIECTNEQSSCRASCGICS